MAIRITIIYMIFIAFGVRAPRGPPAAHPPRPAQKSGNSSPGHRQEAQMLQNARKWPTGHKFGLKIGFKIEFKIGFRIGF